MDQLNSEIQKNPIKFTHTDPIFGQEKIGHLGFYSPRKLARYERYNPRINYLTTFTLTDFLEYFNIHGVSRWL